MNKKLKKLVIMLSKNSLKLDKLTRSFFYKFSIYSELILQLIKKKPNCEKRFFDQIFQRFAHGDKREYGCQWMTHSDYDYFILKAGILDDLPTEEDLNEAKNELDMIYINETRQNLTAEAVIL